MTLYDDHSNRAHAFSGVKYILPSVIDPRTHRNFFSIQALFAERHRLGELRFPAAIKALKYV